MNSREFDSMLDDLVRQALYPFTDAEPPVRVWRRMLRTVRAMRAELAAPAGLLATISRLLGFLSWMKDSDTTYAPLFSNRSYGVQPSGRYLPSPFWEITLRQMFDLHLTA
jgi:hypothetical protein